MSILIRGMEMPTNCEECRTVLGCCDVFVDGTVWCRLAHGYIGDKRTVCPLAFVPPHGRLIDADALIQNKEVNTFEAVFAVAKAPTIIPAEEAVE